MKFEEWQQKYGPNGAAYDIEMQRAGWDGRQSEIDKLQQDLQVWREFAEKKCLPAIPAITRSTTTGEVSITLVMPSIEPCKHNGECAMDHCAAGPNSQCRDYEVKA